MKINIYIYVENKKGQKCKMEMLLTRDMKNSCFRRVYPKLFSCPFSTHFSMLKKISDVKASYNTTKQIR